MLIRYAYEKMSDKVCKRMALRALLMSTVNFSGSWKTISDSCISPYSNKAMANIKERFEIDVDLEASGWICDQQSFNWTQIAFKVQICHILLFDLACPILCHWLEEEGWQQGTRVRSGPSRFRCRIAEFTSCDTWSCHSLFAISGFGTYLIALRKSKLTSDWRFASTQLGLMDPYAVSGWAIYEEKRRKYIPKRIPCPSRLPIVRYQC